MKNRKYGYVLILMFWSILGYSQQVKSLICGTLLDEAGNPVMEASIVFWTQEGKIVTKSDSLGNFCSDSLVIGRIKIQVEKEGFITQSLREVEVKTGNSVPLTIVMQEKVKQLNEVVVKGKETKSRPNNSMALIGARKLNMEEASRYAGGFDDPARLASSFGGAAGGIGNNGITVRGNKPGSFQWRMEGMEIPNPNHFADVVSFGAGGLSALSSQLISNADFYTGGFPAEYGNALSGIMDIRIRNGNANARKYAFKLGTIGTEFATEGPFVKGKKSTYNFHYRYSTLSLISFLLPPEAGGIKYQDVSMKLYFPTQKWGKFSLWYLGALDKSGQIAERDSTLWKYDYVKQQADSRQGFSVAGASHKWNLKKRINLNSTAIWTFNKIKHEVQQLDADLWLQDYQKINTESGRISGHTGAEFKHTSTHTNKTGLYYSWLYYDNSLLMNNSGGWDTISHGSGTASYWQFYTQSKFILGSFTIVGGLHSAYVSITKENTVEPRFSLAYLLNDKNTLACSYGNHSQLERIQYYQIEDAYGNKVNSRLKLSRAHHQSLAWETSLSEKLRLKAELYYQYLYNIPVVDSTSFSLINVTGDWFFDQPLVNKGKGQNIGIDLTLERFMEKGFYYLFSGSIFDSRYQGGDGKWYDTRYNRNWIANILFGKEWKMGRTKNNLFNVNVRFTYQGGEKITPVVYSGLQLVEQQDQSFSKRLPTQPLLHFTLNYRINKTKHSSLWSLQVLNALSTPEIHGFVYNNLTQRVDYSKDILFIPNLSYKIEF